MKTPRDGWGRGCHETFPAKGRDLYVQAPECQVLSGEAPRGESRT
jgi:hypothetical protein